MASWRHFADHTTSEFSFRLEEKADSSFIPPCFRGEYDLLYAMLERVAFDLAIPKERQGALTWINEDANPSDEFSFAWVMDQLDLPLSKFKTLFNNFAKNAAVHDATRLEGRKRTKQRLSLIRSINNVASSS